MYDSESCLRRSYEKCNLRDQCWGSQRTKERSRKRQAGIMILDFCSLYLLYDLTLVFNGLTWTLALSAYFNELQSNASKTLGLIYYRDYLKMLPSISYGKLASSCPDASTRTSSQAPRDPMERIGYAFIVD